MENEEWLTKELLDEDNEGRACVVDEVIDKGIASLSLVLHRRGNKRDKDEDKEEDRLQSL